MPKITYKSLFTLVQNEIDKSTKYNRSDRYTDQLGRSNVSITNSAVNASTTISISEIIRAVQDVLEFSVPARIISGLNVSAMSSPDNRVLITAGTGAVAGKLYELSDDVTLTVPFDSTTSCFYVNFQNNAIQVDKAQFSTKLTLAKIVVPKPGTTYRINDTNNNTWDAYIVNFRTYNLYGDANGVFEEDTQQLLRDNIGAILADNLIGNLRLSENMKITNTQGTMELNSDSLKILSTTDVTLAKFNRYGTFFYSNTGIELAKFSVDGARVGNIVITPTSLQSSNFSTGLSGFRIKDDGNAEFNGVTVRGTIYATSGSISGSVTVGGILAATSGIIGGWTISNNELYATTTGTIKTSSTAGTGSNGVVIDKDGIRVYDAVLGTVANFPSDGSKPTISAGTIGGVTFEINTNTVMRTSSTVGDGSASSSGILINDTGIYGCGPNQTLANANLKASSTGDITLKGEIISTQGTIGGVTITSTSLSGGLIEGSVLRSTVIETSSTTPRIRIDSNGMYYQTTTEIGKYGASGSGLYGFKYGDGTRYGVGVTAYLFNVNYPVLAVTSETNLADIRLYNRSADPITGTHQEGDLICVNGKLKICTTPGSPGTFTVVGLQT